MARILARLDSGLNASFLFESIRDPSPIKVSNDAYDSILKTVKKKARPISRIDKKILYDAIKKTEKIFRDKEILVVNQGDPVFNFLIVEISDSGLEVKVHLSLKSVRAEVLVKNRILANMASAIGWVNALIDNGAYVCYVPTNISPEKLWREDKVTGCKIPIRFGKEEEKELREKGYL